MTVIEVSRENGEFKLKSLAAALRDYEREIKLDSYPSGEHAFARIDFFGKILSGDCIYAGKSAYALHTPQFHING